MTPLRLVSLFYSFVLFSSLIGIYVDSAHIIRDHEEAHHVTQRILQRQNGKKHSHEDVQELRDEFKTLKETHFPNHDASLRKSNIPLTTEHRKNQREKKLKNRHP